MHYRQISIIFSDKRAGTKFFFNYGEISPETQWRSRIEKRKNEFEQQENMIYQSVE